MDDYKPLSKDELERGYFFLTHRDFFKKIFLWVAIGLLAILYAGLAFNVFRYLRAGSLDEAAMGISQNYNWAAYHQANKPQAIVVASPQYFSLGGQRYNLAALVENNNANWAIKKLDYTFVVNGQDISSQTSFLNPSEKKFLLVTGYEARAGLSKLEVKINNIDWYRIDNNFPDVNWDIKDVKFQAATRQTVAGEAVDVPARVTWQAQNLSLYNFWEVAWQVGLFQGDRLIGVAQINARDFLSLETRAMELVWLGDLSRVTRTDVYPVLNKLDRNNFKQLYVESQGSSDNGL